MKKAELQAIVNQLETTYDGVPVTPEMTLFFWTDSEGFVVEPVSKENRVFLIKTYASDFYTTHAKGQEYPYGTCVNNCYSTIAEAKKDKRNEQK